MFHVKSYGGNQLHKLRDKREQFFKVFKKTNRKQHLIQWKKSKTRIQKSSQKEQEGRLEKLRHLSQQQNTYKSSLGQSETLEGQISKKSTHP